MKLNESPMLNVSILGKTYQIKLSYIKLQEWKDYYRDQDTMGYMTLLYTMINYIVKNKMEGKDIQPLFFDFEDVLRQIFGQEEMLKELGTCIEVIEIPYIGKEVKDNPYIENYLYMKQKLQIEVHQHTLTNDLTGVNKKLIKRKVL